MTPAKALPIRRLARYRRGYTGYTVLNTVSFSILAGSVTSLWALRLGANATYIGALGALGFSTFFFMLAGRRAIRKRGIVKVFGHSWMLRYLCMAPILATPFLASAGAPGIALAVVFAGTALFNVFRGVGLIGNNPLLAFMAGKRDRGAFLSNVQITISLASISASVLIAGALGLFSGTWVYLALFAVAILTGIWGSGILLGMPEPEAYRPLEGSSVRKTLAEAWKDPGIRSFAAVFAPLSFAAGTARTFLIVHARAVYGSDDGAVMAYAMASGIGTVLMGLLARKLIDRIGAKPLYVVFAAISALSAIPVIASPPLAPGWPTMAFLAAVNFLMGFGIAGEENAGQSYFFTLVKPEHTLDLSVAYFVVYGATGALGSTLGGFLLDALGPGGVPGVPSFRAVYAISFAIFLVAALGMRRLKPLGATSTSESLGIIFSARDLRTIGLLDQLGKSVSPDDEVRLIRDIGLSGARLAQRELVGMLSSPRFDVRMEALHALEPQGRLERESVAALLHEIGHNRYTTAYVAARILGKAGIADAVPLLREALGAEDYMLRGASMIALARLGDHGSVAAIEAMIPSMDNPRLVIQSAFALGVFGSASSVPVLVNILERDRPPDFVFDEIVLSVAAILGLNESFYPLFRLFSRDADEGEGALYDEIPGSDLGESDAHDISITLHGFLRSGEGGAVVARLIHGSVPDEGCATVLSEAALDPSLGAHPGFRFLLVSAVILLPRAAAGSPPADRFY